MAKQSRKTRPTGVPTRKQEVRSRRDLEQQRRILIGISVVSVIIVVVLGLGFYQTFVGQYREPVARVNGTDVSTGDFQKEVKYRRWNMLQTFASFGADNPQLTDYLDKQLPQQVLDNMIDGELIREDAQRRNISVSADEVEQNLEQQFGYYRIPPAPTTTPTVEPNSTVTATTTPPPTATPVTQEAYQKAFSSYLAQLKNVAGYSEADLRRDIQSNLLRAKIQQVIVSTVPTQAVQIHARHILTDTQVEANAIKAQLDKGADFATLAQQESKDTATKDKGGDLGWLAQGQQSTEFDQAAFASATGTITAPVQTAQGYEIIQVLERQENRPLTADQLKQAQDSAFSKWLSDTRAAASIQRFLTADKIPPMETPQAASP